MIEYVTTDQLEDVLAEITTLKSITLDATVPQSGISPLTFGGIVLKHLTVFAILNPYQSLDFKDLLHRYYIKIGKPITNENPLLTTPDWKEYHRLPSYCICKHKTLHTKYLEVHLPENHRIHTHYTVNNQILTPEEVLPLLRIPTIDPTVPVVIRYKLDNVNWIKFQTYYSQRYHDITYKLVS